MDKLNPIEIDGIPLFDCVFHAPKQTYYKRDGKEWVPLTRVDLMAHLRADGLDPTRHKGTVISQVEEALVAIQNHRRVHYALPLAGYPSGLLSVAAHDGTRKRILVTSHTRPLVADDVPWSNIEAYLQGLLGKAFPYQMAWWKWARKNLNAAPNTRLPAQVMVYIGPAGCGKSFLQKMTTRLLGGRSANPFNYMSGQSSFNRDLFEADHLVVEDCFHEVNMVKRRAFGAKLKEFTVNDTLSCHGKGQDAINLVPKWRISISMNGEHENMSQFPPLDDSILDKVMLIKCQMPKYPTDLSTEEGWKEWDKMIDDEISGLAYAIDNWELGPLAAPRFGVKAYHDRELLEAEDETSPDITLLEIIRKEIIPMFPSETEWSGTALDLQTILTDRSICSSAAVASKLFYWAGACGTYLSRASKRKPKAIAKRCVNGIHKWTLNFNELK